MPPAGADRTSPGAAPAAAPSAADPRLARGLHVVLVAPEIAWNTGNAGRSCLAAGAQLHLVGPLGFTLDERAVRRAGVHHWRHVQPVLWPDWPAFAAHLPALGTPLLFTARGGRDLRTVLLPEAPVLVFGGESDGLPAELRARYAEHLVSIPLFAHAGISLNLSTAVGIALWEAARLGRGPAGDMPVSARLGRPSGTDGNTKGLEARSTKDHEARGRDEPRGAR